MFLKFFMFYKEEQNLTKGAPYFKKLGMTKMNFILIMAEPFAIVQHNIVDATIQGHVISLPRRFHGLNSIIKY